MDNSILNTILSRHNNFKKLYQRLSIWKPNLSLKDNCINLKFCNLKTARNFANKYNLKYNKQLPGRTYGKTRTQAYHLLLNNGWKANEIAEIFRVSTDAVYLHKYVAKSPNAD